MLLFRSLLARLIPPSRSRVCSFALASDQPQNGRVRFQNFNMVQLPRTRPKKEGGREGGDGAKLRTHLEARPGRPRKNAKMKDDRARNRQRARKGHGRYTSLSKNYPPIRNYCFHLRLLEYGSAFHSLTRLLGDLARFLGSTFEQICLRFEERFHPFSILKPRWIEFSAFCPFLPQL